MRIYNVRTMPVQNVTNQAARSVRRLCVRLPRLKGHVTSQTVMAFPLFLVD